MPTKKKSSAKKTTKKAVTNKAAAKDRAEDAAKFAVDESTNKNTKKTSEEPVKKAVKTKNSPKNTVATIPKKSTSRLRQWWTTLRGKKAKAQSSIEGTTEDVDIQDVQLQVREIKRPSGITAFFTQLNYVGMGKFRHSFIQSLALMLNAGLSLIDAMEAQ